jgi:hypothetical protein
MGESTSGVAESKTQRGAGLHRMFMVDDQRKHSNVIGTVAIVACRAPGAAVIARLPRALLMMRLRDGGTAELPCSFRYLVCTHRNVHRALKQRRFAPEADIANLGADLLASYR